MAAGALADPNRSTLLPFVPSRFPDLVDTLRRRQNPEFAGDGEMRITQRTQETEAEKLDRALYLGVTRQKLDCAQIPGAPIDQCRLEEHASCKAMSAFTVAIRCKADIRVALHMSAFDPKRTSVLIST